MARIPLGNNAQFGQRGPDRLTPINPDTRGVTAGLDAAADAARATSAVIANEAQAYGQRQRLQRQESEALARAKGANAVLDDQIEVDATRQGIETEVSDGSLSWSDAQEEFERRLDARESRTFDGLPPDDVERFGGALKRNRFAASRSLDNFVGTARRADFNGQIDGYLDKAGKLAADPSADVDGIIAAARDTAVGMAQQGGLSAGIEKRLQTWADNTTFNHATARLNLARTSLDALSHLETQITGEDGQYTGKLDANRQNALLSQIATYRAQLTSKQQHDDDKREVAGEKAVGKAWDQVYSGLPPKAEDLIGWRTAAEGTASAPEFNEALAAMDEVRTVLAQTPYQQDTYVEKLRTRLATQGGSPKDAKRLDALERAVKANKTQMREAPLLFIERTTGAEVAPLDFTQIASGDVTSLGATIADRMTSITAARAQFGPSIALKPLKPQEVELLGKSLEAIPVERLPQVYGMLAYGIGDERGYQAVMDQVAPKAPLKARAGQIAVRPGGEATAALILRGEAALSTKEGAPKFPMPPAGKFEVAFAAAVGTAYEGREEAYTRDLQVFRAIYAGAAQKDGNAKAGNDYDDTLGANSLRAAVGNVAQFGGKEVLPPWGMPAEDFEERASQHVAAAANAAGRDHIADVRLIATPQEGVYILAQGRVPVLDPKRKTSDGKPAALYIDVRAPLPSKNEPRGSAPTRWKAGRNTL